MYTCCFLSGELHVPLDVCGAVVKRELEFWGISDSQIQPCCWVEYSQFLDNQKILATFNKYVIVCLFFNPGVLTFSITCNWSKSEHFIYVNFNVTGAWRRKTKKYYQWMS